MIAASVVILPKLNIWRSGTRFASQAGGMTCVHGIGGVRHAGDPGSTGFTGSDWDTPKKNWNLEPAKKCICKLDLMP